VQLADALARVPGVEVLTKSFFNELTVALPKPAAPIVEALARQKILAGVPVSRFHTGDAHVANLLVLAATETNTEDDIKRLGAALTEQVR
jgi:glycine dehydrogenase subunit 1